MYSNYFMGEGVKKLDISWHRRTGCKKRWRQLSWDYKQPLSFDFIKQSWLIIMKWDHLICLLQAMHVSQYIIFTQVETVAFSFLHNYSHSLSLGRLLLSARSLKLFYWIIVSTISLILRQFLPRSAKIVRKTKKLQVLWL